MAGDRWHYGRGWWLARVNRYAKKLGATMAIIVLGLLIANLSAWQPEAGVSSWVNNPLTSLAIVELLLAVSCVACCRGTAALASFLVSVLATVFAVLACGWLLAPWLGADASALAALYTATFTGGTLNVSVGRSLAIPDDLFALATAADYVVFTGWFLLSLVMVETATRQRRPQPLVMHRRQIHRLLMPHRLQGLRISPGHGHRVCSGVWP